MKTYQVEVSSTEHRKGFYTIQARTRGDAIMQAQKLMAKDYGLDRALECLARVEIISEEESAI